MLKISHSLNKQGEAEFTIEGMSRDDFCVFINGLNNSLKLYGDAAAKEGKPMAGCKTWEEFHAKMAHYHSVVYSARFEMRNADWSEDNFGAESLRESLFV